MSKSINVSSTNMTTKKQRNRHIQGDDDDGPKLNADRGIT